MSTGHSALLDAVEVHAADSRRKAGVPDPQLSGLRIRNLSAAIAGGDLAARWELGTAIGRALREGEEVTHG